ncbi:19767_t:CDS:2, partial [Funneliformis geosporum]
SRDYDDLSDSGSLVPFKKDTLIYLDHKSTNENNNEVSKTYQLHILMVLTTIETKEKEIQTLMNGKLLIELLDDLTDPQNDDVHIQNVLLERCLNASRSELEEFVGELSNSCIYIPTLKLFTSRICDEPLRLNSQAKLIVTIRNFASLLITDVIMQNLNHSDTPGFGELLHNCIELLWKVRDDKPGSLTDNKGNNGLNLFFYTTKRIFKAILDARVLGILVTSPPGRRCFKRILFDFKMINQIEQEQLLSSVDIVAALVEKCSEHKEVSLRQEQSFSAYKACTALLESLKCRQNEEKILLVSRKNSLPPMLNDMVKFNNKESRSQHWNRKRAATSAHSNSANSVSMSIQDEQYLNLLEMAVPQKQSDLHNLLRELEKRKIELFRVNFLSFDPNEFNATSIIDILSLGGPHIHEVYIDECQDNQIVDFALILKVFDNVDAVFLAGDIAQCIARGSSFRFQDLRALMYQWELSRIQTKQNQRGIAKPKQFELNVNYRSHDGILKLASSVIDLIWHFFPKSIDRLSRERGEIGGPRPIVFEGFQKEYFKVFSAGERMANYIEFGAEQVIIVRDDKAKLQLKDLIGKAGLVMTVFEAKGMEFSDVLLYNFFTDSPARLKWRVIRSDLNDKSEGIQTFSHEKHYILSSELKHLYVAVTRARQHIWICDESAEYSTPIRMYWEHHGLIKVTKDVDEINTFSTLAKKSTSHEIKSPVVIERSAETGVPAYKSLPQRAELKIDPIAFDASEPTTDTQAWFRQIQDSPRAQAEAKKIQDWFRRAHKQRQKSRERVLDQTLEKIYNDVKDFCEVVAHWECAVTQKGEKAVRMYHMLLRGFAVNVIVELVKLQDKMDKIKNKLKKKINDPYMDGEKLESYLELEDDLKFVDIYLKTCIAIFIIIQLVRICVFRYIHNENVKLGLNSISTTDNMVKHEEADIEWLSDELQQARNTIDQVVEWIDHCKAEI